MARTISTRSSKSSLKSNKIEETTPVVLDLPLDLAENILRSPEAPKDDSVPPPPPYEFPDGLIAEVHSAASYAFSAASQTSTGNDSEKTEPGFPNPNITLYCPHENFHEIVDYVVDLVAIKQGADIVTLDSLELVSGKRGIFGEGMETALQMIYKPKSGSWPGSDDHSEYAPIQVFFDKIINIGDGLPLGEAKPRILYMRDFNSIAKSAAPFMPFILKAMQKRRTALSSPEDPASGPMQPVILIMGFAWEPRSSSVRNPQRMKQVFSEGGKAIRAIIPYVGTRKYTHYNHSDAYPFLSPLADTLFLRFLLPRSKTYKSSYDDMPSSRKAQVTQELQTSAACLCIFPQTPHSPELREAQKRLSKARRERMGNMWFTLLLNYKGVPACKEPLTSMSITEDGKPLDNFSSTSGNIESLQTLSDNIDIPVISIIDNITTLALKLSTEGQTGIEPPLITSQHLSLAYDMYTKNRETRIGWVTTSTDSSDNAEKGRESKEKERKEKEEKEKEEKLVDPVVKRVKESSLDKHEGQLVDTIVDLRSLTTSFDDVCIPSNVIESLRTIISLPLLHPAAFKTGILRHEGIGGVLLYGPPGTGKTMVCRALAKECKARMLQIKPSDVMDKYVGETEKLVRAIFSLAYRLAPCVIFIDEIDALFRARTNEDTSWRRDMLNEFMQAMDGLQTAKKNKDAGVVVVGATNRPYDLDDAILRRLPTRMMVDLPGPSERERILRVHLTDENLHKDLDIAALAHKAENYSGSDLRNLCVSAAMASVKEMIGEIQWNPPKSSDEKSDEDSTSEKSLATKTGPDWESRIISPQHFVHAFTEVLASSTGKSHAELHRWHENFNGLKKPTGSVKKKKGTLSQMWTRISRKAV